MSALKFLILLCAFVIGDSAVLNTRTTNLHVNFHICLIVEITEIWKKYGNSVVKKKTSTDIESPFSDYDSRLSKIDEIKSYGYEAEAHKIITSDGYILEVHRIPYRRHSSEGSSNRPVVFLMHGLTASSKNYIELGPEHSIAYHLADAGYDVWMGNARGTTNSRFHITLDPDQDLNFFNFTWEEIGIIDVPAMLDFVLETTGKQKLHYIGHSQGGTSFLVLTTMRPEYNEKIASAHLLAGVGYQDYFPEPYLGTLARMSDTIYRLALSIGFVEIRGSFANIPSLPFPLQRSAQLKNTEVNIDDMMQLTGVTQYLRYYSKDGGIDWSSMDMGGAAVKQFAHYGQNIRDKKFRRWNYGLVQNRIVYGSYDPPEYDLGLITANVTMHYTISDELLDERDVLAMAKDMPNVQVRKVARDSFSHVDFVAAKDMKELVVDYIISFISEVEIF